MSVSAVPRAADDGSDCKPPPPPAYPDDRYWVDCYRDAAYMSPAWGNQRLPPPPPPPAFVADALDAALKDTFEIFDVDGSGRLDIDEVRDLLTNLFKNRVVETGPDGSPFSAVDLDGDDKISRYEFSQLLLQVKTFADASGTYSLEMLIEAIAYATTKSEIIKSESSTGGAVSRAGKATMSVTVSSPSGKALNA